MSERSIRRMQQRWRDEDEGSISKALGALLGVKEGRRFLHLHLQGLGFFTTPFVPDAAVSAFNSGKHSVAVDLFNRLSEISPDQIALMLKENQHVQETRKQEAALGGTGGGGAEPEPRSFYEPPDE